MHKLSGECYGIFPLFIVGKHASNSSQVRSPRSTSCWYQILEMQQEMLLWASSSLLFCSAGLSDVPREPSCQCPGPSDWAILMQRTCCKVHSAGEPVPLCVCFQEWELKITYRLHSQTTLTKGMAQWRILAQESALKYSVLMENLRYSKVQQLETITIEKVACCS